jgi:hypothetical protein
MSGGVDGCSGCQCKQLTYVLGGSSLVPCSMSVRHCQLPWKNCAALSTMASAAMLFRAMYSRSCFISGTTGTSTPVRVLPPNCSYRSG